MEIGQVMSELEGLGSDKFRRINARQGAPDNQFGVSFGDLQKLKKRLAGDGALADALWATANADARVLACMIADPDSFDRGKLDAWVGAIDYYVLGDVFSRLAGSSPHARASAQAWIDSDREHTAACGWNVVSILAMDTGADRAWLAALIDRIAGDIHGAPNRARHSMNMALIAIGGAHPDLEATTLDAAARIGKVDVDHGQTGCKTPDAAGYIRRMSARRARLAGGGKKTARARA